MKTLYFNADEMGLFANMISELQYHSVNFTIDRSDGHFIITIK